MFTDVDDEIQKALKKCLMQHFIFIVKGAKGKKAQMTVD